MMKFLNNVRKNNKKIIIFIYPILSGILTSLSYNYDSVWFLGLFSLIPLIYFSYKENKIKRILMGFFLFGFFFTGNIMIWLFKINVFAWSGVSNFWIIHTILLAYWLFFVFFVGTLVFLIFGWLFFKFKTKTFFDIFLFSFLWILMEYLKSFIFAIVYFGTESLFGSYSTISFLGYVLASSDNLLQLAKYGGVYLLSFTAVFINFLLYQFFIKNQKKEYEFFLIGLIFIIIFFPINIFFPDKIKEKTGTKVSVLQTKNESFFLTNRKKEEAKFKIYEKLLTKIKKESPDSEIIVFPEDTRFVKNLMSNQNLVSYYNYFFGDSEKMIIDSSRIKDRENKTKLRLYYYDLKDKHLDKYDKILFTPGGEYIPISFLSIFHLVGFGDWAEKLSKGKYTKGEKIEIGRFKDKKIGGIFCFEIISPKILRQMTKKGAQLFVNPSSHSTFEGYSILYRQMLNMIKVRAVENNRYFIQAGNYIPSSVVTNKGKVITNKKESPAVLTEKVFFEDDQTLYVKFGNWMIGLAFGVFFVFILIRSNLFKK